MTDLAEPELQPDSHVRSLDSTDDMPDPTFTVESTADAGEAPDFDPPNETARVGVESVTATVWLNNKKITTLWSIDQPQNAYAAIEGEGWKKIDGSNPGAFVNLTMILSAAAQTGAQCRIQLTDNVITAVYAF